MSKNKGRLGEPEMLVEQKVDVLGHLPLRVAAPWQRGLSPEVCRVPVVASGTRGIASPSVVGRDDTVPRLGERLNHVPPLPWRLRESVQKNQRVRSLPSVVVMHPDAGLQI